MRKGYASTRGEGREVKSSREAFKDDDCYADPVLREKRGGQSSWQAGNGLNVEQNCNHYERGRGWLRRA